MARYIVLAENIIEDIATGRLSTGDRMPSIRQYAKLQEVSVTTALNCYQHLEALGWLKAKPQSGFYISAPFTNTSPPQFPTFTPTVTSSVNNLTEEISNYQSPFYVSLIAPELIPTNKLSLTLKHTFSRKKINFHLYPDYQGEQALRESLAAHFNQQYFPISSSDIVITNGCIDALKSAIEITTNKDDAIAICSPCFVGIIELIINMGRKVVEVPFHQAQLDLDQLELLFKNKTVKALLLSANHINPQGLSIPTEQKIRIAKLAQQYETPVIEDDVYLELSYRKLTPLPIKHWDQHGWVLWCGSFSKTLSPSIRLGWCHPGRYFRKYLKARSVQNFGVNAPLQHALADFINNGHYLKHIKSLKLALSRQAQQYHQTLKCFFPPEARITTPLGGLVIWVQIPGLDGDKLFDTARTRGIHFRPGSQFTTLGYYQDCIRINIGWPITPTAADVVAHQHYNELVELCQLACQQLDKNS